MAKAMIEIGEKDALFAHLPAPRSYTGKCLAFDELEIEATVRTSAAASEYDAAAKVRAGANMHYAIGTTPDPTAVAATAATSAKRYLASGELAEISLPKGAKISVVASV
jgi:hypothetical protein